jgi:hypothetical protein
VPYAVFGQGERGRSPHVGRASSHDFRSWPFGGTFVFGMCFVWRFPS